jgi:hypothetical protein
VLQYHHHHEEKMGESKGRKKWAVGKVVMPLFRFPNVGGGIKR